MEADLHLNCRQPSAAWSLWGAIFKADCRHATEDDCFSDCPITIVPIAGSDRSDTGSSEQTQDDPRGPSSVDPCELHPTGPMIAFHCTVLLRSFPPGEWDAAEATRSHRPDATVPFDLWWNATSQDGSESALCPSKLPDPPSLLLVFGYIKIAERSIHLPLALHLQRDFHPKAMFGVWVEPFLSIGCGEFTLLAPWWLLLHPLRP